MVYPDENRQHWAWASTRLDRRNMTKAVCNDKNVYCRTLVFYARSYKEALAFPQENYLPTADSGVSSSSNFQTPLAFRPSTRWNKVEIWKGSHQLCVVQGSRGVYASPLLFGV